MASVAMRAGECDTLLRQVAAGDLRGLAGWLAPEGQALPHPDRLYRGLSLDDASLSGFLANLTAGKGVPSREAYSPDRLADLAVTKSLAHGIDRVRALFKDRTAEMEAVLRRLEDALVDLKRLFRAEVASRLAAEPQLETQLFEPVVASYVLGEIPPYLQSMSRGGDDGAGAGAALFVAVVKGLKHGKHSVVVEADPPASSYVDLGVPLGLYPTGVREVVMLGDIPGRAVRAVWIDGRRFTPPEFAALAQGRAKAAAGTTA